MKQNRKFALLLVTFFSIAVTFSGCAAVTALKHPGKKNLSVLSQGTSRENIIAYLGAPVSTEKEGDQTIDIYQFKQGYSGGNKATRAVVHLTLDVFTLFIWELIGWPAEVIIDGNDMTIKAVYDQQKRLSDFTILKQE